MSSWHLLAVLVSLLAVLQISQSQTTEVGADVNISDTSNNPGLSVLSSNVQLNNGGGDVTTVTATITQQNQANLTPRNEPIERRGIGEVLFSDDSPLPSSNNHRYIPTHIHFIGQSGKGFLGRGNSGLVKLARDQIDHMNKAWNRIGTKYVLKTVTKTYLKRMWFELR